MNIVCYEYDPGFVLERFRQGAFDYLDAASEVVETEFFRFIGANKMLGELAQTYPTPRKKEEVPVWFFLASNLSMRLHGAHSFNSYPYVVRCGGMLNAFGPNVAHKAKHPETGDVTLSCHGFNKKNDYDRQTPCDQDFLRKFARDTEVARLTRWHNQEVPKVLKAHKAFDPEGIFIGDASYLFVPDNEAYEGSVKMLFDEKNHPVTRQRLERLTPGEATRCQWKRCYKMVSLLHTDRKGSFFLRVALVIWSGNQHECQPLYGLVDTLVSALGKGVMKRLILDRGFIDGAQIGRLKQAHDIDILIPVKKSMTLYGDVLGLMKLPDVQFQVWTPPKQAPIEAPRLPNAPEKIKRREAARRKTLKERKAKEPPRDPKDIWVRSEVAGIDNLTTLESCPIPLNAIINKETYQDGHEEIWMLLDTKAFENKDAPSKRREDYHLRVAIEEGHRQFKCFWDLTEFTSRSFSLVVNQVIFVALAYNLFQLYLKRKHRTELNRRTRPRVQNQLLPNDSFIIIYCENRFALVTTYQYTELLLTLAKAAKQKILTKSRRLQRELAHELTSPRPP